MRKQMTLLHGLAYKNNKRKKDSEPEKSGTTSTSTLITVLVTVYNTSATTSVINYIIIL